MVEGELGHGRAAHGMANEGKIPHAKGLRRCEQVPGKGLHRIIRFRSGALRIAGAAIADGQGAEAGWIQGLLDQAPDTGGRPIAVDQYEQLWPCPMLEVLKPHVACLDKVCSHTVLLASVEIARSVAYGIRTAEGAPELMFGPTPSRGAREYMSALPALPMTVLAPDSRRQ